MILGLSAAQVLHAACACVYLLLALLVLARGRTSRTGAYLLTASLLTAAWAGSVAILPGGSSLQSVPGWLELGRSAAWYALLLHLFRRSVASAQDLSRVFTTLGLLVLMLLVALPAVDVLAGDGSVSVWSLGVGLRLALAVGSILLTENLYLNTPADQRWNVNLLCIALGGLFLYDLLLYADAILFRRVSIALFVGRASVSILLAPLLAIGAVRDRRLSVDLHVSRSVVFHSATLMLSGLFLLGLAAAGEIFRQSGAEWGVVAEVTLISGGMLFVLVLLTSGSARARARALLVDHFFSLRYDYRQEWMRCIAMLSSTDAHLGLHTRAIRAVTQVVDSPAGALWLRDPDGTAFLWAGSWNMPATATPIEPSDPLLAHLAKDHTIVDLASQAAGSAVAGLPRAWLAVPVIHGGHLIGFVVVARSRSGFKLDREALMLLGIVGQEVAVHLAEQSATRGLGQARQIHEYGKRFAFVVHDIKNVSGQLSMLLANAEVHADNPEFQRDMLATVRASVTRIGGMLRKMQAQQTQLERTVIVPIDRVTALAAARRDRELIAIDHDGQAVGVAMDQDSFDSVLTHLLNNAAEASALPNGGHAPIRIRVRHEPASLVIDLIDQGGGMSAEFIRDTLFSPFASTKREGHGIGAFQARELLREAGGDLLVISRVGEGTTMRILLPGAGSPVARTPPELAGAAA